MRKRRRRKVCVGLDQSVLGGRQQYDEGRNDDDDGNADLGLGLGLTVTQGLPAEGRRRDSSPR